MGWRTVARISALALAALAAAKAAPAAPVDDWDTPRALLGRRMDAYFDRPNSAPTWRALSGLGDPQISGAMSTWAPHAVVTNADRPNLDRMTPRGPGIPVSKSLGEMGNCRLDYALLTARRRVAARGAADRYVAQWFAAQRAVFTACADRDALHAAALPPPLAGLDARSAQLQADDRAYQQAALDFYRRDNASALRRFAAIAAGRSEHRAIARYMVLLMRHNARLQDPSPRRVTPDEALAEIEAILADPQMADAHEDTRALLGMVSYDDQTLPLRRAHVRALLAALKTPGGQLRRDPEARADYARAIGDADFMFQPMAQPDWWIAARLPADHTIERALAGAARRDRLALWLAMPISHYHTASWRMAEIADAQGAARRDWRVAGAVIDARARHGGDAWRLLRMTLRTDYRAGDWRRLDAEIRAATRRTPDDRLTADLPIRLYHQVRLAVMDRGHGDEPLDAAIARLRGYPFKVSHHYRQTVADALRYLMSSGRLAVARRLRDALAPQALASPPLEFSDDESIHTLLAFLAEDPAHMAMALRAPLDQGEAPLLNRLSIRDLTILAARKDMTPAVRALLARTAWARSYALGRPVGAELDRLTRRLNPDMTRGWRSHPGQARPGDRRTLADVLASPALAIVITDHSRGVGNDGLALADGKPDVFGIDTYQHSDNNWWCAWQPARHAATFESNLQQVLLAEGPDRPARAVAGRRATAVRAVRAGLQPMLDASLAGASRSSAELAGLSRIASAPRTLSLQAIAWGRRPGLFEPHDRPAEALALAVRATRYGCQRQGGHGAYSRAAFQVLHQRYGDTAAARRTPAWFDCSHFSQGCPTKPGAQP